MAPWEEQDSNLRRRTPADLQSAPVDRFGIFPCFLSKIARPSTSPLNTSNCSSPPPRPTLDTLNAHYSVPSSSPISIRCTLTTSSPPRSLSHDDVLYTSPSSSSLRLLGTYPILSSPHSLQCPATPSPSSSHKGIHNRLAPSLCPHTRAFTTASRHPLVLTPRASTITPLCHLVLTLEHSRPPHAIPFILTQGHPQSPRSVTSSSH